MQPKRAIASEEAAAKKARPWAKEFNEKMAPFQASAGSEAWPEDLSEAIGQVRRDAIVPPKPAMIGVRPPAKPAGNLIKSLKAD